MNTFLLLQYDLHDTFKELIPIEFSWTRQLRQHTHIWVLWFPNTAVVLHHRCLLLFCKALPLTPEFLTSYERFFMIFLKSSSSGSMKKKPHNFSGLVELWFLDSPLSASFRVLMHQTFASTYLTTHCRVLRVVCFLVSLPLPPPDHVNPWHFISYNNKSCETCPCFWQFSIFIYVPVIFNMFFQQYMQWRMCCSGNVDTLHWNRKWFFSRHVQFDSVFHMMATNEVSCDRPASSRAGSAWCGDGEESPSDSRRRTYLFLSSFGTIPDWGGWSLTSISSRSFDWSSCDWEYWLPTTHRR